MWWGWKSITFWGISVLIFGIALWLGGALNWPGGILYGVIAASMIWRAGGPESRTSYMSQVRQIVSILLIIEVMEGVLIKLGITWLGYRWKISAFQQQGSFWLIGPRTALLLFPALLLWPHGTLQQPVKLILAFDITVLVIGMSYFGLSHYFPKKNHLNWKDYK